MAVLLPKIPPSTISCQERFIPSLGISVSPSCSQLGSTICSVFTPGRLVAEELHVRKHGFSLWKQRSSFSLSKKERVSASDSSGSSTSEDGSLDKGKTPFGYTRKDVILIGVGLTLLGYGMKSGLEYVGVDSLQAGNVVEVLLVLGLTVGWIFSYIFRVSNKEMTYAKQLRDYEYKVMEKRLDSLTEAEIAALLEQVEEEKRRLGDKDKIV
ncbi:unnamed protein product [Linum trigynum]|uniref:MAR-binding filament-like protein 1-1 n=1 Tax=Linum trigynum TaxID=586398 RepID=A0AAV2D7S5_9ROSI